jgi:hypothetical protein
VALDVADEGAVQGLFASLDHVDHVAMLAGSAPMARSPRSTPRASRDPSTAAFGAPSTSAGTRRRR